MRRIPPSLKKQLGIFGIGGKKGKSETESKEEFERQRRTDTTQRRESEQQAVATGETQARIQERQVTELLSEEARGELESLMGAISAGGAGAEDVARLGQFITERALGAEEAIRAETSAIVGEARRRGEADIERRTTELASAVGGSTQSSLIQQIALEGGADLEANLARLAGELNIAARQTGTQELIGAAGVAPAAQAQQAGAVAALANALRGGVAVAERTGETVETARQEELVTALERLIGTEQVRETGTSRTKGKTKSKSGGFSINI